VQCLTTLPSLGTFFVEQCVDVEIASVDSYDDGHGGWGGHVCGWGQFIGPIGHITSNQDPSRCMTCWLSFFYTLGPQPIKCLSHFGIRSHASMYVLYCRCMCFLHYLYHRDDRSSICSGCLMFRCRSVRCTCVPTFHRWG
jgi:hypothetical protein